jgi:hypothetical protein
MTDFKKIIEDLKVRGWTQTGIARAIGTSRATICHILKGDTRAPKYQNAAALILLHTTGAKQPALLRKEYTRKVLNKSV